MKHHVLTIAGSDSSGGAGIQADLKTMSSLGVFGMSVITAVTAQNTVGVFAVEELSEAIIRKQIQVIFEDIRVDAVKIGMVSSPQIIRAIHEELAKVSPSHLVIDPVMVSKSGYHLLKPDAIEELKLLIATADVVTPNIPEAELLTGMNIESYEDMKKAAAHIGQLGVKHVLLKGGHRVNTPNATDVLYTNGEFETFQAPKTNTIHTHGTGCTMSSAIASYLALGLTVFEAVSESKKYITNAIVNSFSIGHGHGPVDHFAGVFKTETVEVTS